MEAYQTRAVNEKDALDLKIEKLLAFINEAGTFKEMTPQEQKRMNRQEVIMELYSEVLAERIEHFEYTI